MNKKNAKLSTKSKWDELKEKLPRRYAVEISKKLGDIPARTVIHVFEGKIKNPLKVTRIYKAALEVKKEYALVMKMSNPVSVQKSRKSVNA